MIIDVHFDTEVIKMNPGDTLTINDGDTRDLLVYYTGKEAQAMLLLKEFHQEQVRDVIGRVRKEK